MNLNELSISASALEPGHWIDLEPEGHRQTLSYQEALKLPSIPSDPEWVSPFTLPPLPAFRKNRGQSNLLRSPEENQHLRSSSSAYYAAAWGSPYATPSPNRSPPQQRLRRRSQDLETASPLSFRTREYISEETGLQGKSRISNRKTLGDNSVRKRASSWDKSRSLAERFNWLSESDLSGNEADIRAKRTPTRDTYLKNFKASVGEFKVPRSHHHQVQESIATITPETFNAEITREADIDNNTQTLQVKMEQKLEETGETHSSSNTVNKPLPNLPSLSMEEFKPETGPITASPESPSRPRIQSMQSFQRPKRKVVWRGKTCIIALPLTDRESEGLPPLLTSNEIKKRMQKWVAEGYDVSELMFSDLQDAVSGFGQSRPLFPDPQEMYAERKDNQLLVHIPDQSEWDAWVDYLKEEKLRALGVTPSNSEPPMSIQSPFSSTLSRVSSTYPSVTASPPVGAHSVNGNPVRIASNTFSPPLGHQGGMSSHGGSHVASPSISGWPGPMHGYKQSIAQARMTSPYDYPISHPGSYGPGMRNTPGAYGHRQFSPPTATNLQSLGQVLSPIIPTMPSNDGSRGIPQHPTMEQIRQQQQRQQQLHQHMIQHQRQYSYFPPQSKSADQLPRTPILESPSRHTPEIIHPTPRSHRHNLSAALQKGVDDAEAARSDHQSEDRAARKQPETELIDSTIAEDVPEEEPESELPVLSRPEILPADDKSEIETNPSIAASPMLMDNKDPFAAPFTNLQHVKEALIPQPQHKPKPSMSILNVEAPEFDPLARFSSSNFSFGGQSFQPAAPAGTKSLAGGSRPSFTPKNLSFSKLNVEAPAFTPSFMVHSTPAKESPASQYTPAKKSLATPSKSSFTFSSPTFNADAPEFKPSQSFSFTASTNSMGLADDSSALKSAGSIFGNVTIDLNTKSNRRGGKTVPITRPRSSGSSKDVEPADDDDEGRVKAPSDRQKRARRIGDDDAEELLFADSAPFDHAEGLSSKKDEFLDDDRDEDQSYHETTHSSDEEHTEIAPEIILPLEENAKLENVEQINNEEAIGSETIDVQENGVGANESEVNETPTEPSPHANETVVEIISPTLNHEDEEFQDTDKSERSILPDDKIPQDAEIRHTDASRMEIIVENNHKPKFSLSALAKPFEFRPGTATTYFPQSPVIIQTTPELKKSKGLMASRFAAASPDLESPPMVSRNNSPPQDMYEYVDPEATDADLLIQSPLRQQALTESPVSPFDDMPSEATPQLTKNIEEGMQSTLHMQTASRSSSQVEFPMPSYEEIDAVMKQFENNPDLGVERDDTPVKSTPLIDMRLHPTFRSDAPSPSPRRTAQSPQRRLDWGLGIHKLNDGRDEVSDWNEEFSPRQEYKLENQAQFLESRVNHLVGGMLENRLVPMEQTLQTIQQSLVGLLDQKTKDGGRRSLSTENREESDADDEGDYNDFAGLSSYRSRSPNKNYRRADRIRAIIMETIAAYQPKVAEPPSIDLSGIHNVLGEMRQLAQPPKSSSSGPDLRTIVEDAISSHPHFKAMKKQDDHEAIQEKLKSTIDDLEASLKEAENRADKESLLRERIELDIEEKNRKLLESAEQIAVHREAFAEAQLSLAAFVKEKDAYHALRSKHDGILKNNKALEDTLQEYRLSSDQFRDEIKLEHARNQDLIRRMHNLRQDFNEKMESHQSLKNKLERLQENMTQAMRDVHAHEEEWRHKEHELILQNKTVQAALDHEIRHREKIEIELDTADKEHKESMRFRLLHEHAQVEITQLQAQIAKINDENKLHQDTSFRLQRELGHSRESAETAVLNATSRLQSELDAARVTIENLKADSDAQISRLQKRVDDAELDLEEQKANHDAALSEALDLHKQALHESNQKGEAALEEQHLSHERKLNDLRERHTRALHNSSDDRHRLEYHLNEKLALGEERVKHLESQVKDLEERLEITKSAARAAVEAATAKTADVLTPAPSVMASPPQRLSSASLQMTKGTDVPEKISPQALRESIMVLQDQLQNREQTIEQLENEISSFDKDAPAKIKERDNEIALLRELLSVRVDDLEEIIGTLSQQDYDREATKNAAIRLKANLQMEQQLKERAAGSGGLTSSLPSISAITNLAQSPRGLPMAAAAAWGNWRKARDFGINTVSDIATNISQTPSKSAAGSPSSFLAGIMTPPSTSQRTPPPSNTNPLSPPTMRPLAAAAVARKNAGSAIEARPLRIYSTQARALSSRQIEKRRESNESTSSEASKRAVQPQPETPLTPLASKSLRTLDLGEDVDEDASLFDISKHEDQEFERSVKEAIGA